MRPKGKRHETIPVPFGGEFTAGDITMIPDGTVRTLRNYVIRPGGTGPRFDGRPPFVDDGETNTVNNVSGFAVWQDIVNEVTVTIALQTHTGNLFEKNTNGIGYAAAITGVPSSDERITGYTNFLGKLYMMFSSNSANTPLKVASFDGTNVSLSPFNSVIVSRDIKAYNERLFFVDPRVVVTPLNSIAECYGSSVGSGVSANFHIATIVSSTTTIIRISPTLTSFSDMAFGIAKVSVAASTSTLQYLVRQDIRNNDISNNLPLTFYVQLTPDGNYANLIAAGSRSLAVTVGQVGLAAGLGNSDGVWSDASYIWRCTQSGTTAVAAPTFTTTGLGGVVTDGTAKWTAETVSVVYITEPSFPPASATNNGWVTCWLPFTMLPRTNAVTFSIVCFGGNTATPTMPSLNSFDIGYKDGLADGDPRKQNYGFQVTAGDFYYPFVNTETATTNTINIDAVIWSEIENPKQILAKNTYPIQEIAGIGTAMIVTNGRLVVFKRRGMWIFKGVADINEPILPEIPAIHVGCLGPRALDVSRDGYLYWIGEQHIYKMNVGTDASPTEIDTPGMYETIMSRGGGWIESQGTYNLPMLVIDHANKDVWVYAQKGLIYVYSMQYQAWSYFDTNPTGNSAEVQAMIFDSVSNRMLVSFGGYMPTRFDETSDAADNPPAGGATFWNITNDIVPRPFELYAPRYEASLLEVGLFHLATLANGTLTLQYSYDRGATWTTPAGYPVSNWITNPRIRLALAATGESVSVKLSRTGAGGARNWSISKADALLRVHRGELTKTNPT